LLRRHLIVDMRERGADRYFCPFATSVSEL